MGKIEVMGIEMMNLIFKHCPVLVKSGSVDIEFGMGISKH